MFNKNHMLVIYLGAWIMVVLTLLTLFQSLSYEYFFVLSLIGFLIIVELMGPFTVRPEWRARVNVAIIIGVILFGAIVVNKVLDILDIHILGL